MEEGAVCRIVLIGEGPASPGPPSVSALPGCGCGCTSFCTSTWVRGRVKGRGRVRGRGRGRCSFGARGQG